MILVSSSICLCPIYWSQVLSREWRCSWSSADRWCSNYIWAINNLVAFTTCLILETWWYILCSKTYSGFGNVLWSRASSRKVARGACICETGLLMIFIVWPTREYLKTSSISRTKSANSNVSCILLQLSLLNPLKPGVKLEWRCSWSSSDRQCSNYIWVINNLIAY